MLDPLPPSSGPQDPHPTPSTLEHSNPTLGEYRPERTLHIPSDAMGSHTEGASGVLGVVKTVMMLEKGMILPNANFEEMSSNIVGRENLKVRYHRM